MSCRGTLGGTFLLSLICACVAAGQAQNQINILPPEVSLAAPFRSTTPVGASFNITAREPNTAWKAEVRYFGSAEGWLSPQTAEGVTPATLALTANASRLDPGTYSAQVTIRTATSGVGRFATVLLTVGASAANTKLAANTTSLIFFGSPGFPNLPTQTLNVSSLTGQPVRFRVLANSSGWLNVPPITFDTPGTIPIEVNQSGLAAGQYTGSVSLLPVDGSAPTVVGVTLVASGESSQQPVLEADPFLVNVAHQTGPDNPPNPPDQPVAIASSQNNAVPYTATSTVPWLLLSNFPGSTPATSVSGTAPDTITLKVNPANLDVDATYSAFIQLRAAGHAPLNVPVSLRLSLKPVLSVTPGGIRLTETERSQTVLVRSTGEENLGYSASVRPGINWLSVAPSAGITSKQSPQTLTISANPAGLPVGLHTAKITLAAENKSEVDLEVRFLVTTVAGAIGVNPSSIPLRAVVGDPDPQGIITLYTDSDLPREFTAAAVSNDGWLVVEPSGGTAPAQLVVRALLSRLPGPGSYSGGVQVTAIGSTSQTSVPVTLTYVADEILVEPSNLTFQQPQRGVNPEPATFTVNSPSPTTFYVSRVPPWMRLNTTTGVTPTTVTAWVDMSVVPPGSTGATILVTSARGEKDVPVSVRTADAAPIALSTPSVTLTYNSGAPTVPAQIIQLDTGSENHPFTATAEVEGNRAWLLVTPEQGRTPGTIRVTVNPALVAPGQYTGNIVVKVEGRTTRVPVSLTVVSPVAVPGAVVNAATLTPASITPGQMLTITGNGLGPTTGITPRPSAAGAYETRVGDTRVLFDGVPAPILYLRNDQINVIAPYALANRVSTRMQIEQADRWSLPIELRVSDAAPGIFTVGGTGRGQAAATNEDLTGNSAANPALRGSIVTIYGTGEGQTDPAGQDGRVIATDLRRPLLPVSARIGGVPAEVLYLGSASGAVSGMFQANIRVPSSVEPGVVPIDLQIGSARSPSGVTIVVR